MGRRIILAKTAGFCFGVRRAVDMVYENIRGGGPKIYMLGPVIHNNIVVEDMLSRGAFVLNDISELTDPDGRLVIRAHGIPKKTYGEMEKKGVAYIDATCPFVKKIHDIVSGHCEKGYEILIVGDSRHPEVQGISGWCEDKALVFADAAQIASFFGAHPEYRDKKLCLVSQTTANRETWLKCVETLKKICTNLTVFDTICYMTGERQREAIEIAKNSDIMVVVGSRHSSNTAKLVEICRGRCPEVILIEDSRELPVRVLQGDLTIGVTAGASTPAWIIKEVINRMSDENIVDAGSEELSFAEAFEKSIITLSTGDIVKGVIVGIAPNEIHVDLGTKHDGYIPVGELTDDVNANPEDIVKVGDEIEVFVVRVNDVEGTIMLSKKKIEAIKGWREIEKAREDGTVLPGSIVEAVRGGVIALVNGVRVFVPASLAAERYISDLQSLVGSKVRLKITDINKQRKRVVGSIKPVLIEEKKEKAQKVWDEIEEGKAYQGVVKSLVSYGAFVDIGGVDGMIHVSELSWNRVKHPSEVLKIGDAVEVIVIKADKETGKISLSLKKPEENPWEIFTQKYKVGDTVDCTVVKMMPFGAFAQIIPGIDGLIHISQIADRRISKPADALSIGQVVQAKITKIDYDTKKVNLSIRELLEGAQLSSDGGLEAPESVTAEKTQPAPEEAPAPVTAEEPESAPGADEIKTEPLS